MGDVIHLATFVPKDRKCPRCQRLPPYPALSFTGEPGMRIVTSVVKYDYVCVCGAECETEREYGPADERDT